MCNDGGLWNNIYEIHVPAYAFHTKFSIQDPSSFIRIFNNVFLFLNGKTVESVGSTNLDMFVYKSDFTPVNLNGRG